MQVEEMWEHQTSERLINNNSLLPNGIIGKSVPSNTDTVAVQLLSVNVQLEKIPDYIP